MHPPYPVRAVCCLCAWPAAFAHPPQPNMPPAIQVVIKPGDDLQAQVSRNPPSTTFLIKAGIHRLQSAEPKSGSTFIGEKGAVLSGAQPLTAFTRLGKLWVAGVKAEKIRSVGECSAGAPACNLPEDLFVDNVPLRREMAVEAVSPGRWYLDYNGGKVYLADDPKGHQVELSLARYAFAGEAHDVIIRGLTIEKYASPTGAGAVHGAAFLTPGGKRGVNWIIQDNEIRWNHDVGVYLGNGMHVLRNHLHHNGHMGAGGTGKDVIVDGNEIDHNNYSGYDYHWASGGAKFVLSDNLQVRNNYVHDNEGPGLWSDIDNDNVIYENNRTSGNKVAGIFFEISFGAIIRNNQIENDGANPGVTGFRSGAGIVLNTSSDAQVYGNRITDCPNGILAIQQDRGVSDWTHRTYVLKNLKVHDNTITQKSGIAAGIASSPAFGADVFTRWNNTFEGNTYKLPALTGAHFVWMNGERTIAEWKSFHNDGGGQFLPLDSHR